MTSAPDAERRRVEYGYAPHSPRCSNCAGYRRAQLRYGVPRAEAIQLAHCSKGGFVVEPHGCCDKWTDRRTKEGLEE